MGAKAEHARHTLADMARLVAEMENAPTFADMPRRTLADKRADGPTSAHVIEEVHVPFNLAALTLTTGSTAFQNIVGVTFEELPERAAAGAAALARAGGRKGDSVLVCYPPLANVFSREAFDKLDILPRFLRRSSRDAFLVALCEQRPHLVVGESSFLRAALEDAHRLDLDALVEEGTVFLASGTPLDKELAEVAASFGCDVHDLYGCQEFGWLALDGSALRDDIVLVADPQESAWRALVVGGLPTGDSFPVSAKGHVFDPAGDIITYARRRTAPELEVVVRAATALAASTVERTARTIMRIKSRVVRAHPRIETGAAVNVLELRRAWPDEGAVCTVDEPGKSVLFQRLLEAQEHYQARAKSDPLWMKRR